MDVAGFISILESLVTEFSYFGIFLASLISSSTVLFPLPIYFVNFLAAGFGLNPLIVGLFSGVGSGIGELTGYFVGFGGRYALLKKQYKVNFIKRISKLFTKYGFWLILSTAFIPFPFDIIGIISGVSKYDIKKFLLAVIIGKIARMVLISYAGFFGLDYIVDIFKLVM